MPATKILSGPLRPVPRQRGQQVRLPGMYRKFPVRVVEHEGDILGQIFGEPLDVVARGRGAVRRIWRAAKGKTRAVSDPCEHLVDVVSAVASDADTYRHAALQLCRNREERKARSRHEAFVANVDEELDHKPDDVL